MMTIFEALADPTRRQILDMLRERPHLVGELTDRLQISQPGVSKQLRVLREAGLVRVRQDAQRHWYEIRPEPLAELDAWLQAYRHLWEARFERMDKLLVELQELEKETDSDESQTDR
ncbi:MAG TPA: metalloregulator ArsR/SmtB family transcription factor [Aggregatilineales bacterium]|nr:metalloregulator ArsR/SmtB family transcription factor [Aggregatilineales bacterium]